MADLGELDRSGSTKIAGSDATGLEDNFMNVDSNGSAYSILRNASGSALDFNYGTIGFASLRVAAQIGNATGSADFNSGVTGAQTMRVASNLYDGSANALTSTLINSKRRIDANLPSEAQTGTAAPFSTQQIGGINPSGNIAASRVDRNNAIKVNTGIDQSVFGPIISLLRIQQVAADFSQTIANNDTVQTVTGTGSITLSNSNATISTGSGTTSSAQLQSKSTIIYAPGREIYVQFTALFTTPTSAASTQYAGLYNGADGLLIGYNGLSFGIATVASNSINFVSASSFNLDLLNGNTNSSFTRAGIPEAIDFTLKNVFRIRAGWLGAAPIYYEVLSPDGVWVTFHMVRQPNTSANPSFLQPSLPITILVTKTASDATNLQVVTTSWDAGIVDAPGLDISGSGAIAALNGTINMESSAHSTIVLNITGTWVGTLQFQGDVGDGTFNPIYGINTNLVSSQSVASNTTIIIPCAGFDIVRVTAISWSSGSANINWTSSAGINGVIAQAVGNIASGQPDTGNPLKVGGVYNAVLPTVVSGSRVDLQLDSNGRLLTSTAVTSSLPAATFSNQVSINTGVTIYTTFTAAQKLAIKQFYAGGIGIGKQTLYSYFPSNSVFVNSGDFETAGDVTNWPYFSAGGAGTATAALATAQFNTGTHSESVTFTTSDANHSNGIKQTFSSPVDFSGYRYVQAHFFNTLSSGGAYTRTISIVLTDSSSSTRTYSLSGSSTVAPFNTSNWIQLLGEIANPISSTGTSFDPTQISSMELRFVDSANKSGTVYWDTVKLISQTIPVFPIYHQADSSFNISIDPVFVMNIGDQILLAQTNNDTIRKEYFALAGGVSI